MSNNTNTTKIEVSIVNGVEIIEVMLVPEGGGSPALQDAIAAEATTRQTEDAALQDAIDAEAVMRAAGDVALQDAIDAEAVIRAAGDAALQDAIDAEAVMRAAGDVALQDAIDAEATTRQAEDAALQDAIDAEAVMRAAGDVALQDAIDAEATTRQAEDAALQDAIDAEAVMRAASDVALQDQITANRIHEHLAGVVDTSYAGPDPNSDPDPDGIPSIIIIDDWSVDPATQIDGAKYRVRTPGVRDGVHYPAGMIVEVVGGNFVAYGWNPVGADGKITEVTDAVAAEKTAREAWQQLAIDQFGLNIDRITATETAQAKRVRVDAVQTFSDAEMTQARANIGAAQDPAAADTGIYNKALKTTVAVGQSGKIQFNLASLGIPSPSTFTLYGLKIIVSAVATGSVNLQYKEFYAVIGFRQDGTCYFHSYHELLVNVENGSPAATIGTTVYKDGDFVAIDVQNTNNIPVFFQTQVNIVKF